jgi:sentrin-specific protease 7
MEVIQKVAFQKFMAGDDVRNDAEAVDSVNMEAVNDHTAQVARVEVFNKLLHSKCEDFNLLTFPFLNPINCGAIDDAATNLTELEEGRYPRTGRSEDRNRTTITVGNWNRLAPGRDEASHFNDTIIDFWSTWITREYSVGRKTTHDILIVNSHTFQLLADAAYNKDMSSLAVFKKNDIFKKKLVLFPIQQHNHWSLCVLVNPGKVLAGDKVDKNGQFKQAEIDVTLPFPCMLYLDPLPGQHDSEKNSEIIRTWLNVHWAYHLKGTKNPFNKGTYPLYKPTVPSQSNYTDCGVFVCRYIFAVYKLRALTFSYEDARVGPVPGPRDVQPACEVCWQKLHHSQPFQFDGTDITRIRAEIQTLIMNLFHLNNKWNINLN